MPQVTYNSSCISQNITLNKPNMIRKKGGIPINK